MKQGLLPLCQESLVIGDVSYHSYRGIFVNPEEKVEIQKHLGVMNKVK